MSEGRVHYSAVGGIATVVFDRPEARNAMTWAMYGALAEACNQIAADDPPAYAGGTDGPHACVS